MAPRLAVFDLDNTLIDRVGLFRRWAAAFLERHGQWALELPWLVEADGDGAVPRPRFFEAVAHRYGLRAEVAALVDAYDRDYPTFAVPPPRAALQALSALKDAGWRVAVVTNGPPMQERVVDAAGLRGIADAVIVSSTVGLRKPDPRSSPSPRPQPERRSTAPGWSETAQPTTSPQPPTQASGPSGSAEGAGGANPPTPPPSPPTPPRRPPATCSLQTRDRPARSASRARKRPGSAGLDERESRSLRSSG